MRSYGLFLLLTAAAALAAPVLALPEPAADEARSNRQRLDRWRANPDHLARLKRDWKAFLALAPDRQEQMRQLDRDLHEEDSATQARLGRVMDRYVAWLERLPEADRRLIDAADDAKQRLRVVKELKDREYLERLPRAVREKILAAPKDQHPLLLAKERADDRLFRQQWQPVVRPRDAGFPARKGQPKGPKDFPQEVQIFITETLLPLLGPEEKARLKNAEDQWPQYVRTLVELAEGHPLALPGPVTSNYTRYQGLPKEVQDQLSQKTLMQELRRQPGIQNKWPDFAIAVTEYARNRGIKLHRQLGPSKPEEFAPTVRQFINVTLDAQLAPEEKERLRKVEGLWPEYPRTVMELARHHNLQVPGMALPGPREYWEGLRHALPDVPDARLKEFALTELTPAELAELHLGPDDPASRERLKQEYFKRKPRELDRLLKSDEKILKKKREGL
jgi:hypothetical protein